MKKGDTVTYNGQRYTVAGTSDDWTEDGRLEGRRMARTIMEWAGIPPITKELLAVEPYSEAELATLRDSGSRAEHRDTK